SQEMGRRSASSSAKHPSTLSETIDDFLESTPSKPKEEFLSGLEKLVDQHCSPKGSETAGTSGPESKNTVDASFREHVVSKLAEAQEDANADDSSVQRALDLISGSLFAAEAGYCSGSLPSVLISDLFDMLPVEACEQLFHVLDSNVQHWKKPAVFTANKNNLLRLCNDLLRRLSRCQNTVFCGRILLFLARFFPLSERSGLNVIGEFNLENVTAYGSQTGICDSNEDLKSLLAETTSSASTSGTAAQSDKFGGRKPVEYNMYCKFWSLQDFFRNPNQCYGKVPWKTFTMVGFLLSSLVKFKAGCCSPLCSEFPFPFWQHTSETLDALSGSQWDGMTAVGSSKPSAPSTSSGTTKNQPVSSSSTTTTGQFFPKYLTNQKLLDLQLSDTNFRRYILVQFLILFQYLSASVKFKNEKQMLSEEQFKWIAATTERVRTLIEKSGHDGPEFLQTVQRILKREETWNAWKNEGCPATKKPVAMKREATEAESSESAVSPPKRRRQLGMQVMRMMRAGKYAVGNIPLTRLWNQCPDNDTACRSAERNFTPSLEEYFGEAISQLNSPGLDPKLKKVNDPNYGWRALRLLSRMTQHFFTPTTSAIIKLPDYLEMMIRKIAKDIEASKAHTVNLLASGEKGVAAKEEGGVAAESPARSATPEDLSDDLDQEGADHFAEAAAEGEDEKKGRDERLVTEKMASEIAPKLGESWTKLAKRLGFKQDEIEWFESEGKADVAEQARLMLKNWVTNEGEMATVSDLKYWMEADGLEGAIQEFLAEED
ncbi:unnamed protein product, partial [Cyprideis torosa]